MLQLRNELQKIETIDMEYVKNQIWFIIALNSILISMRVDKQETNNIQCIFTQTNSGYTFYGNFRSNASADCLLEVCFNYENIKALAPDAKEVLLTDRGCDWNKISYTYLKFNYFENKSQWYRKLHREKQRVDFTLVSSKNNLDIIPRIISSSGFYQIKQQGEYNLVEYYQECCLTESPILKVYLNRAKKEAVQFMHRFSKYTVVFCPDSTSSEN